MLITMLSCNLIGVTGLFVNERYGMNFVFPVFMAQHQRKVTTVTESLGQQYYNYLLIKLQTFCATLACNCFWNQNKGREIYKQNPYNRKHCSSINYRGNGWLVMFSLIQRRGYPTDNVGCDPPNCCFVFTTAMSKKTWDIM